MEKERSDVIDNKWIAVDTQILWLIELISLWANSVKSSGGSLEKLSLEGPLNSLYTGLSRSIVPTNEPTNQEFPKGPLKAVSIGPGETALH